MKILELFSGYGTASFALKRLGIHYEIVGYSDIDKYANQCFQQNHGGKELGDVKKINPNDLEDFDLLTGGFPCQAFSTAGKMQGELDPRGTLFYEIIRIAEVKKPKYMLLENVKGLTSKKFKDTFNKILSELDRIGYNVYWKVLNSKDYGIPQSRARVWFVCFRKDIDKKDFKFPEPVELKIFIKDILEPNVDSKYYLSEKLQQRFAEYLEEENRKLGLSEPAILDLYNHKIKTDGTSITLSDPCHNNLRLIEGKTEFEKNGVLYDLNINPNEKTRDVNEALEYALNKSIEDGHPTQLDLYHLQHGQIRPLTTYVPQDSKISRCLQAGEPKEILVDACSVQVANKNRGVKPYNPNNREMTFDLNEEGVSFTIKQAQHEFLVAPKIMNCIGTCFGRRGTSQEEKDMYNKVYSNSNQLRRLTPKECFRLMGFLNDEINLDGLSDTQRYKLAGNGQDVNMVSLIFKEMFK